jgi:hypothetical protein
VTASTVVDQRLGSEVWLVSFMQYDLGFFDQESGWITSVAPLRRKSATHVLGMKWH